MKTRWSYAARLSRDSKIKTIEEIENTLDLSTGLEVTLETRTCNCERQALLSSKLEAQ